MVPLVVNSVRPPCLGLASDGLRSVTQALLMTADIQFDALLSLDQPQGVLVWLSWRRLDRSILVTVVCSVMA